MHAGPSCGCVRLLHCSPQAQADGCGVHEETVTGTPAWYQNRVHAHAHVHIRPVFNVLLTVNAQWKVYTGLKTQSGSILTLLCAF